MSKGRPLLGILAPGALLIPAAAGAGDLSITPVRLALTPGRPVATMTIRNAGADSTTLQLRVLAWSQKDGEDVLEPTQEVLANPGGFALAPGASQLARFGLRTGAGAVGKSYRVLIEETPRADIAKPGQIATLLRVSVPIFIDKPAAAPAVRWSLQRMTDGQLSLLAANTGSAHVQVTRVTLTGGQGAPTCMQPVSVYVLPGSHKRIELRPTRPVAPGDVLTLKAETDAAPLAETLRAEEQPDELAAR